MATPLYPQNNNQDEDAKLKCKYFKWADEEENPPCNYCRESAKRQAKTGDNAGREFYCCMPRVRVEPMGRANNCGFFDWADGGAGGGGGFTNGGKAGDDADEGRQVYNCTCTAAVRTVKKDGPNQGTECVSLLCYNLLRAARGIMIMTAVVLHLLSMGQTTMGEKGVNPFRNLSRSLSSKKEGDGCDQSYFLNSNEMEFGRTHAVCNSSELQTS